MYFRLTVDVATELGLDSRPTFFVIQFAARRSLPLLSFWRLVCSPFVATITANSVFSSTTTRIVISLWTQVHPSLDTALAHLSGRSPAIASRFTQATFVRRHRCSVTSTGNRFRFRGFVASVTVFILFVRSFVRYLLRFHFVRSPATNHSRSCSALHTFFRFV